jgi:7-keto-8-aminopelargonate synthetase-like enzyme
MQSAPAPHTTIDGKQYLYFAGTGYLGIQCRPELAHAACNAIRQYGIGTATTRAGFGNNPVTLAVEQTAAQFFAAESAFYFASGYSGAGVLARAVAGEVDAVFVDEQSHFSVMDALRILSLPQQTFRHRNPQALKEVLSQHLKAGQRPLVISDGVFPVSGEIAPAADYFQVLSTYDRACLALDDAHALAVLGQQGRGTLEHANLFTRSINQSAGESKGIPRLLLCGTLSKAVGGYGGIVPGSAAFIDSLVKTDPVYFAASPPPVPAAAATEAALRIVIAEPTLRHRLHENVHRLKQGLRGLGLKADSTPVPIVPVELGAADRMKAVQAELMERGVAIAFSSGYSSVGPNGALRIAVFATHTPDMIDRLLEELGRVV